MQEPKNSMEGRQMQAGTVSPTILKIPEAAELLRCDQKTVRRLIDRGQLPVARLGLGSHIGKGAIRIRLSDINNLFKQDGEAQ
jgi:excisionase family DNA binding protein